MSRKQQTYRVTGSDDEHIYLQDYSAYFVARKVTIPKSQIVAFERGLVEYHIRTAGASYRILYPFLKAQREALREAYAPWATR